MVPVCSGGRRKVIDCVMAGGGGGGGGRSMKHEVGVGKRRGGIGHVMNDGVY